MGVVVDHGLGNRSSQPVATTPADYYEIRPATQLRKENQSTEYTEFLEFKHGDITSTGQGTMRQGSDFMIILCILVVFFTRDQQNPKPEIDWLFYDHFTVHIVTVNTKNYLCTRKYTLV